MRGAVTWASNNNVEGPGASPFASASPRSRRRAERLALPGGHTHPSSKARNGTGFRDDVRLDNSARREGGRSPPLIRLSSVGRKAERRRRIITRGLPVALIGVVAFVMGVLVAGSSAAEETVRRFVDAWARDDFDSMHAELSEEAADRYPLRQFTALYEQAESTATLAAVDPGDPEASGSTVTVPVDVRTHSFGEVRGSLAVPMTDDEIAWEPRLTFPGLAPRERLTRRVDVPRRASILARGGVPLAEGSAATRSSPLGTAATNVTGELGVPKGDERDQLERRGFPPGSLAGTSGLEAAFNTRLAGQPGGELLAVPRDRQGTGRRVLASARPRDGKPVRTTIDPDLQEAAVSALGNEFGGVAVLDAKSGAVRGLAGIAFSSPQPPGSTFKVVTTTAALEAGVVTLKDSFPVQTSTVVGGREIANAHDEACGGTFSQSFAHSCNTVFAPLGPEIGNEKLVETSERFGFNSPPALYDAEATAIVDPPPSTIPTNIGTDLDLGVSAIGQGEVLATPLELATISQTIANGGVRSPTPIVTDPALRPEAKPVKVTSGEIAATVRDLMVGVVSSGTGTAAALPGVEVAGKTGTAELGPAPVSPDEGGEPEQQQDAWFTAFAPADNPQIAVAVLVANTTEDGGTVAAPIAREVLAAGIG
jgi:penicillin-binding protein A